MWRKRRKGRGGLVSSTPLSTLPSLQSAPGSLKLTGILGLAAALYLLARGGSDGPKRRPPPPPPSSGGAGPSTAAAPAPPRPPSASIPASMRAALAGARSACISAPGVLLAEGDGAALENGATLLPGVAAALATAATTLDRLYLLARVEGDVGEAAVRGALEAGGVVGPAAPVPPQRLLFVSTRAGKVAAVRALDVGLHVDADAGTLGELAMFVPRLVRVGAPRGGGDGGWSVAPSLGAALGV